MSQRGLALMAVLWMLTAITMLTGAAMAVARLGSATTRNRVLLTTREAATQVLVKDGQTIVLGGVRDRQKTANQTGIPVLSHIPIIGGLFGSAEGSTSGTELYLFLTPWILKTDVDVNSVTAPRLPKDVQP